MLVLAPRLVLLEAEPFCTPQDLMEGLHHFLQLLRLHASQSPPLQAIVRGISNQIKQTDRRVKQYEESLANFP